MTAMRMIEPINATRNDQRLNPVNPAAPKKLMTKPPISAPTMPVTMFLTRLPSVFMIMFAIQPAKPPMMIHTMMLIAVPFLEAHR